MALIGIIIAANIDYSSWLTYLTSYVKNTTGDKINFFTYFEKGSTSSNNITFL